VKTLWHQALASGGPFSAEVRLRRHDGAYRWHLLRASLVSADDGSPLKWYGTTIEIDDERRRGKEFEVIAQRLHTTLESITDGFMTLDRDWRFTFMNSRAQSITRLRSEEVLGKVLWDVVPGVVGTVFEERFRRAVDEQVSLAFDAYYQPLELWVDVKAYPSEEGLAIYFHDHSVRRKLEQQLRESQRLEAVGHLTGGMAHDFNNLLTVILGNAEILGETLPKDSPLHNLAQMVVVAAERGADLTQRLLAFARRQPLEPEVLDINQLINNLDGLLRRTLGGYIDIEWVRAPALWPALVDPAQLESAVLNLAINARDAMSGGGRLTIETANTRLDDDYVRGHVDLKAGQYVMVAVSDTGSGIAPGNLRRVFEPFFTTKEVGKGTGLGLSMVFGFVKQSGGHINIYSEEGEGTTVRMYLPRAFGEGRSPPSEGEEVTATGGDAVILLVEDDDLVRDYASQQLIDAGYQVLCAVTGREALAILQSRQDIDLLFTDVVMPGGMSGRELADRAQEIHPSLRVLYTSGYTENAIVHHGRLDPGVQLLNKPYRRALLLDKVRQVLG
ncbi:MAG: ATP-binding protein, partial [Porticoccaceae bacterium]